MRDKVKKGFLNLIVVTVLIITFITIPVKADAATKYITGAEFVKLLVRAIGYENTLKYDLEYVQVARQKGIVMPYDTMNFSVHLTREDAALLLNRTDIYLHGDTLDKDLYQIVLEKRISDIDKIATANRSHVAEIVAKGIIKGYSNGFYIQNRAFRGDNKITYSGAESALNLVVNPSKRAKLSTDGMLIRTTKLPRNAEDFEYILECYPNEFYEKKYAYMFTLQYQDGTLTRYNPPVDMKKHVFKNAFHEWEFTRNDLYEWTSKVKEYLYHILNVDYHTVDDEWRDKLTNMYALPMYSTANYGEPEHIQTKYIDLMKKNKVIVESDIVAVEPSTLYFFNGATYMRAYVRFRITAKNINVPQDQLVYNRYLNLLNLKSGEWRDCVVDVRLGSKDGFYGNASDTAIDLKTYLSDTRNVLID